MPTSAHEGDKVVRGNGRRRLVGQGMIIEYVVFHHFTYSEATEDIQALLVAMAERNRHSRTIYELLGSTVGCTR